MAAPRAQAARQHHAGRMLDGGGSKHVAASPWLSTVTPGLSQPLEVDTTFHMPQSPRFLLCPGVDTPTFKSGPPLSPLPLSQKGQCCTPQYSSCFTLRRHWPPAPLSACFLLPMMAVLGHHACGVRNHREKELIAHPALRWEPQRQVDPRPRPSSPVSKHITASGQTHSRMRGPPSDDAHVPGAPHMLRRRCPRGLLRGGKKGRAEA